MEIHLHTHPPYLLDAMNVPSIYMCAQIRVVLMQLQACDFPSSLMTAKTHTHTHSQCKAAPPRHLTALWIKPVTSVALTEVVRIREDLGVSFPLAGRADKPGRLLSLSVRLLLSRSHSSQSQLYSIFFIFYSLFLKKCHGTC